MATYHKNGDNGMTAFVGFRFNIPEGGGLYIEMHGWRNVEPRNKEIISYMVVSEQRQHTWELFCNDVRWMFALDRNGNMFYNVHGKGEALTYDKWELYPMNHDYFNKTFDSNAWCVVYSNGLEYQGRVMDKQRIQNSIYNINILRVLADYKVAITEPYCAANTVVVNNDDSTPYTYTYTYTYTCSIDLFKRGDFVGVPGWLYKAHASLRVEFEFVGNDADKVTPNDVDCIAMVEGEDKDIRYILGIEYRDKKYKYSLNLNGDVVGFWFYSKETGRRLDVDMVNFVVV